MRISDWSSDVCSSDLKTRDWSRQMQTVEHLVALEQPQKPRQKHGTQDKRGRHRRARSAFHGKALRRHRWHPGSAAIMRKLLACKECTRAVRAGVRSTTKEHRHG